MKYKMGQKNSHLVPTVPFFTIVNSKAALAAVLDKAGRPRSRGLPTKADAIMVVHEKINYQVTEKRK